jgi:hypothetical protein
VTELRAGLPPLPPKMRHLPVDERLYPVPFFVAWVDGKPDHRVADARALKACVDQGRCWLCGEPLGRFKAYCIGPMCTITRTISEPPQHLECSTFAAMACPFLTRPLAKRREANLPEGVETPAGMGIRRNPGAVCVWVALGFKPFRQGDGILFDIGEPTSTFWYCEGRAATRAEVDASIESGLPILDAEARAEGQQALNALAFRVAAARALLDRVLPVVPSLASEGTR